MSSVSDLYALCRLHGFTEPVFAPFQGHPGYISQAIVSTGLNIPIFDRRLRQTPRGIDIVCAGYSHDPYSADNSAAEQCIEIINKIVQPVPVITPQPLFPPPAIYTPRRPPIPQPSHDTRRPFVQPSQQQPIQTQQRSQSQPVIFRTPTLKNTRAHTYHNITMKFLRAHSRQHDWTLIESSDRIFVRTTIRPLVLIDLPFSSSQIRVDDNFVVLDCLNSETVCYPSVMMLAKILIAEGQLLVLTKKYTFEQINVPAKGTFGYHKILEEYCDEMNYRFPDFVDISGNYQAQLKIFGIDRDPSGRLLSNEPTFREYTSSFVESKSQTFKNIMSRQLFYQIWPLNIISYTIFRPVRVSIQNEVLLGESHNFIINEHNIIRLGTGINFTLFLFAQTRGRLNKIIIGYHRYQSIFAALHMFSYICRKLDSTKTVRYILAGRAKQLPAIAEILRLNGSTAYSTPVIDDIPTLLTI